MSGLLCDTVVMTCSHLHEPYEQLLQRLIEHHHTGSVRQCRFGGRDGGRFGWRRMAHNFPLGFGGRLFVLNTMREAKFEDLLAQLIHNLIKKHRYQRKYIIQFLDTFDVSLHMWPVPGTM